MSLAGWLPFDPLKKNVFLPVEVLVGMQNVSPALMNPPGDFCHDARLVRTMKQGDD